MHYFSQKNTWMTGEILEKVLLAFNHRLLSANRCEKGKKCKGGKGSKERITVALITNAVGDKEKAVVVGKSENPRCF